MMSKEDELRTALADAIREIDYHNAEYKYTTPDDKIAKWRGLATTKMPPVPTAELTDIRCTSTMTETIVTLDFDNERSAVFRFEADPALSSWAIVTHAPDRTRDQSGFLRETNVANVVRRAAGANVRKAGS